MTLFFVRLAPDKFDGDKQSNLFCLSAIDEENLHKGAFAYIDQPVHVDGARHKLVASKCTRNRFFFRLIVLNI